MRPTDTLLLETVYGSNCKQLNRFHNFKNLLRQYCEHLLRGTKSGLVMDVFLFLWVYFAVSLSVSLVIFTLYLLLLRYGKLIRRSDTAKAIVAAALLAASLTFLWYSISTTFTIFNKWLMTRWHGGFRYPLLTSSVHMVCEDVNLVTAIHPQGIFIPIIHQFFLFGSHFRSLLS